MIDDAITVDKLIAAMKELTETRIDNLPSWTFRITELAPEGQIYVANPNLLDIPTLHNRRKKQSLLVFASRQLTIEEQAAAVILYLEKIHWPHL